MTRRPPHRRTSRTGKVTLARALSKLGFASRSKARELIRAGHVRVDGRAATDPDLWVDPDRQRIEVDGARVEAARRVYLMLNKPRGLVTTASDEKGRPTVFQCIDDPALPQLFPVGRLDRASEGLLLFTNDTQWADRILDPRTHLDKVYHVQIDRVADPALLRRIVEGVRTDTGEVLAARCARALRAGRSKSWIEVVLDEGKNRQIRRILEALDVEVLRLVRVAIGPLELGELGKGEFRELTEAERDALSRGPQADE